MYVVGHISVAYLAARAVERDPGPSLSARPRRGLYVCAIAGALFPDAVDKYILLADLSLFGRTVGHSVFVLAAAGCLAAFLWLRAPVNSVVVWFWFGYATHFGADVANDLVAGIWHLGIAASAWPFWPLLDSDAWYLRLEATPLPCRGCYTLLEVSLAVGAAVLLGRASNR